MTAPSSQPISVEPFPLLTTDGLDRFLREDELPKSVAGTTNPAAFAQVICDRLARGERPLLIIVGTDEAAEPLRKNLHFFDPQIPVYCLPPFDVSPYSQLYPNKRTVADRLTWLFQAQRAGPHRVFIASIAALLQKTLPFQTLAEHHFELHANETLPNQLKSQLESWGYQSTPLVEDVGTFSIRQSIVDIYSPAHANPIRLELFGDVIESLREFDAGSQRSLQQIQKIDVIPAREAIWSDETLEVASLRLKENLQGRDVDPEESRQLVSAIAKGHYVHGVEFLLSLFFEKPAQPLEHFNTSLEVWWFDAIEVTRSADELHAQLKAEFAEAGAHVIRPKISDVYDSVENLAFPPESASVRLDSVHIGDTQEATYELKISDLREFSNATKPLMSRTAELQAFVTTRFKALKAQGQRIFIASANTSQSQRLSAFFERCGFQVRIPSDNDYLWATWLAEQQSDPHLIHVIPHSLSATYHWPEEDVVFFRDDDFFGRRVQRRAASDASEASRRMSSLSFGDLKVGDFVVHKIHGLGVYEGLKVMPIGGVNAEFIQLSYKEKDRLYLPVYRVSQIQKFSGPAAPHLLDRLGGASFEKTKTKVRSHLRDVAMELLNLYAQRSQCHRLPYGEADEDFLAFENAFPYDETPDQLDAIQAVLKDMNSDKPMDRLICGDVGFGKTEIAMRAAFKAVQGRKQVCVIAPTTVLTFQHLETFQKRFKKWPVEIRSLNRFVAKKEQTETLQGLKSGTVDIVIGTHRLLSKDIAFKDLGLLIIDEEQKFGVRHKERLRKMKTSVDTLAMSATPIPRTLNMSLMGVRDISLINTPPVDRLPTRTFVCKFDKETIRKAVMSEMARGGQIYFIHNRIQSIYALVDELRELLPDVKMRVGHGQMDETQLEETMLQFFHHEIDMLVCTAIVESGMDVSQANTMFIDQAQHFGLSQLYQLRGRVGRSKERAYCYLMVPPNAKLDAIAQERLKVLQENTALGSGIKIAHYDLELRGVGDFLGESQSGHIQSVGYELYLELLDEAVRNLKGEPSRDEDLDPDINVRIPALIPDDYIADIRTRLSYYKALSEIEGPADLERIEDELRDQFGKPPESVMNLMGLMLIRHVCKSLSVRDLSSGKAQISLTFTERTRLSAEKVVELSMRANKKYGVTPDHRLNIRMNEITWPHIYDELIYLESLIR